MAYNKISNKTPIKDIKYLNKDFNSFRSDLLEFSKTYYPNTFSDFTEGSPGMMFMEMASYVGDVLSYYVDTQLSETFLDTAQEKTNLFHLAYTLGYRPKVTSVSSTNLDIFQLIPSKGVSGEKEPDFDYALTISQPSTFKSNTGIVFTLQDPVVFSHSSSFDPTETSIYSVDSNGEPFYYLLKKSTPVISAERKSKTFDIGDVQRFLILNLIDDNIISIESIVDSQGNVYTEVPYLAQDIVFENIDNVQGNTTDLHEYQNETPYLLKLKRVPKRFVSRFTTNNVLEIQFGAGDSAKTDEEILPIPDNIGLGGRDGRSKLDQSIDPSNFLHSQTYGKIPSNTTLTVNYLVGGGISSNVFSNTINNINSISISTKPNLNGPLSSFVRESLVVSNPEPATGGGSGDTVEDLRLNTVANFSAQQRVITREDYLIRTLSMPSIYGSVSKAYIVKTTELENVQEQESSQISSNLYVLGYDLNKKITTCNTATKTNLVTYLNFYKPLTDSINIMDGFIINFGIDFEITTFKNNNNQQVLLDCISELKEYFNIDKWQINQPIIKSEVINTIANVKGVQSVISVAFKNLTGAENGYSKYQYDFDTAEKNGIIYPSLDPSIFEIKFLNSDIKGNIKTY